MFSADFSNAVLSAPLGPISAASGQAVTIDLDLTAAIQVVLFALLVLILKPLLLDPALRVFALREERTDGAKTEARELQERAGELLRQYEAEQQRINRAAAEARDQVRGETARLEAEIMKEARVVTTKILDDGRQRVNAELDKIRTDLKARTGLVSKEIADAALGRGGQS